MRQPMPERTRSQTNSLWRQLVLVILTLYALLFVALSVDILVRIWDWRWKFEHVADMVMLLYFEGLRALLTVAGIAIAWWAVVRTSGRPGLRELPLVVLFGSIAYAKVAAYKPFAGAVQEKFAEWLVTTNTPRWLVTTVFSRAEWIAWLGIAGIASLLAHYPRALTSEAVLAAGATDRRGALRDIALAGTDVGALSRRLAARLLDAGWLTTPHVWLLFAAVAALHTGAALAAPVYGWLIAVIAGLVALAAVAVCVALYRAALVTADAAERIVLEWLRRGALAGAVLFGVAGAAGMTLPGPLVSVVALSLAPAAMLLGIAVAVAHTRRR